MDPARVMPQPMHEVKSRRPTCPERDKCLIKFVNRTCLNVDLFWLDFHGLPKYYGTLRPGAFLDMDTYIEHIWLLRAQRDQANLSINDHKDSSPRPKDQADFRWGPKRRRLVAIPEEVMMNSVAEHGFVANDSQDNEVGFQGISDTLPSRSSNSESSTQQFVSCRQTARRCLYSCKEKDHIPSHCTSRRNIYIYEPFYSLKEWCFLSLPGTRVFQYRDDVPNVIQRDYIDYLHGQAN